MNAKGHCYPKSIILQAVYFKLRFALSYRDVEEIMKNGGGHFELESGAHFKTEWGDQYNRNLH